MPCAPTDRLPQCPPPHPAPSQPALEAPPGAWDCHAHIFGPLDSYALNPTRSYDPAPASLDRYRALLRTLGLSHAVIVQPSVYGTDNRCTADAIRASRGAWRGVAVVDPDIAAADLQRLHADGFRGVRFNLLFRGGAALDDLETVATRIAPLGWHVQLLLDGRELPDLSQRLLRLPAPFVIDHMGHCPAQEAAASRVQQHLLRLLDSGRCWIKLSGAYRLSAGPFPYPDTLDLARRLVQHAPERLVWGSDWPHPAITQEMPDDGRLFDQLAEWAPSAQTRQRILVHNPGQLYASA